MARKRRPRFSKRFYYHVYNRGNWKFPIFYHSADYTFFIKKMKLLSSKSYCNIKIKSYCLMDNHYHLLIKQLSSTTISKFIQRLSISYSMYLSFKYNQPGHSFQGRFKSKLVRSSEDLERLIAYFQRNPEKAGYVHSSEKYRWLYIGTDLDGDGP